MLEKVREREESVKKAKVVSLMIIRGEKKK